MGHRSAKLHHLHLPPEILRRPLPRRRALLQGPASPPPPLPRLSMVRTLLLSSPSTSSSSDTTTTASRDSTASHSSTDSSNTDLLRHLECDSSRPSSVADDELKRLTNTSSYHTRKPPPPPSSSSSKYFSLPKLSSVFRKEQKNHPTPPPYSGTAAVKRVSSTAKEVIRKYLKKVKPLYEKLSQKQQIKVSPPPTPTPTPPPPPSSRKPRSANTTLFTIKDQELNCPKENRHTTTTITHSFSGNLQSLYRRPRSYISSCPSSMRSSPSHGRNGVESGFGYTQLGRTGSGTYNSDASSMEELQSAIQGAIAHCKNSMLQ
ncbi:putative membrane-associated kinase regulator 1 [Sesamum alatum]|uniref:Membrane-associated kinase regulator 1 n=1 Tax=Sesamum alatum TaxID=300844 RepID=A0AAE2CTL2_9LAMI|nr:putative membrane-associated kinase regulator 1 [Sesamum alatum]